MAARIVDPLANRGPATTRLEISKLIEPRTKGQLSFHIASLYPLLSRLEKRGWIEGRWAKRRPDSDGGVITY